MKLIVVTTSVVIVSLLLLLYGVGSQGYVETHLASAPGNVSGFLTVNQIEIEGSNYLSDVELRAQLPESRQALWWLFNRRSIQNGFASHPFVKSAAVKRCSLSSLGCYKVQIEDQEIRLAVPRGDALWLVGERGKFITPVEDLSLVEQRLGRSVPVYSTSAEQALSPERVAARLSYLAEAVEIIDAATGADFEKIELQKNGEFQILLTETGIPVRFDYAENDLEIIRDEANRLERVLKEIEGRESTVEGIDLAYDRIAVVKFATAEQEEST